MGSGRRIGMEQAGGFGGEGVEDDADGGFAGGAVALGGVVLASGEARPRVQGTKPPDGVARADGVEARSVQKI
jgi:hypothetical protein